MSFSSTQAHGTESLAGDGVGFVASDWKNILAEAKLCTLDDFFSISGKSLPKAGLGKRYRAQLELKNGSETLSVFYKRYDGESLRSLVQRWFEDGKRTAIACREVRVAKALEKIGISTFRPVAWGWRKNAGIHQKSFIVMSQVPGTSIERWLPTADLIWRKKLQLVEQLAILAKQLHEHGWFHRDFYLCHIFLTESDGNYRLAVVDLARMFRPRWRVGRWQVKDLAQLNYSAPIEQFSRAMRLRFAKLYFGCHRLTTEQKSVLRRICRRTERIRLHDLPR